jgi:uncharacterized membrane protein YjgN (DUF898 family)
MTDSTGEHRPWDLEQYRGVKERPDYNQEWDRDRELELDASFRTGNARPVYAYDGPSLFWLALGTALLTVLTLGIYRFWMTTRLRAHYWQSIHVQGDPFEYTGTGIEKLLGFLVAIVILAVYLGLINLGLAFIGMSYFSGDLVALNISILAAIPLFFFAEYRARRYIMARTRWRGIRFGMGDGALGYTVRAVGLWILTILTAGLLYPYKQFKLTKYIADRTWFGNIRFEQGGSWAGLFAYWVWIYIVLGLMALSLWGIFADKGNPSTAVIGGVIITAGYFALFVMFLRYEVVAFRYLWNNRRLGDASFTCEITPAQVIKIYVLGSLGVLFFSLVIGAVLIALAVIAAFALVGQERVLAWADDTAPAAMLGEWQVMVLFGAAYLVAIAASYAFSQIFITRPILSRKAQTMTINNIQALSVSRQREHDHAAEAGGFADALGVDVGGGF